MDTLIYAAGAVIVVMLAYVAWLLTRLARGQGDAAPAAELASLREAERAKAIELSAMHVRLAERDADLAAGVEHVARLAQEREDAQERAERIGASLTIVTAPRKGTEVVIAWEPPSFTIPRASHA
jgi:hypothetical protein